MSTKLTIYNAIDLQIKKKVKDIQTFGIWNNQFEHLGVDEIDFNFPAVFVEFASIPWTSSQIQPRRQGNTGDVIKQQKSQDTIITLHIGFSFLKEPIRSFRDMDPIIDKIYFALQGLEGEQFSPLLRIDERQDTEHGRIIDWQVDFRTMMEQTGELDKDVRKIEADTLDLDIEKDLQIDTGTVEGIRTDKPTIP